MGKLEDYELDASKRADEYLIKVSDLTEQSILNILTICPVIHYKTLNQLKDGDEQLMPCEVDALIFKYKSTNQAHCCDELMELALNTSILTVLRIKNINIDSIGQRELFHLMIHDLIARIIKLRDLIERWAYYTKCVRETYSGSSWDIFHIIDKMTFVRITAYSIHSYMNRLIPETIHIKELQTETTINQFNNMPMRDVEKWFMQLSKRQNKQGELILTENEIDHFIRRAFLNTDLPKLNANYGNGGKWNFIRIFYEFYEKCTSGREIIDDRPNIRDEYIKLLINNFEGFSFDEVKENFAKSKNSGQTWKLK
ncbi:hypothetical protein GCM10028806_15960 [Spirosoma terrae]|uniref:Uncharacterized protein n=1 Tax=Spirosoma terrae TaxID=1968276 RepID=A0A6L9L444_9BACT|nr:hypothetical protein [Spirosoma terrae]NDU95244.1 hypothetical protein [Spirosoma terrae]